MALRNSGKRRIDQNRQNVVIVGGGWTGLSAAVALARHSVPLVLFEAARQLGGRARAVRFGPFHVDNGQHLLLGAYESILDTLKILGVSEASVFRRQPMRLLMLGSNNRRIEIKTDRLPAPFHLASGLLRSRGISFSARLEAVQLLRRIRRQRVALTPDRTLGAYLAAQKQSPEAIHALWRPLCYAALNTPPEDASARLFIHTVRDAFLLQRRHSDLLLPTLDLSACLPRPATDYIENRGALVRLNSRVDGLEIIENEITGVRLNDAVIPAKHVILATPPQAAADLLSAHTALQPHADALRQLQSQPICTVYLRYPDTISLERDMVGLLDALPQWLFDRGRLTGDKGLIAAVISGAGAHLRLTNEALAQKVAADIAQYMPAWPAPLETKVVREKHATLAANAGVDDLRPGHAMPVRGLWLAGDYTATGYPSTLEGAVKSGLLCARWVLRQLGITRTESSTEEL